MQEPTGLISDLGRSPGEGNGNLLQYSCLGNPRDRGAWQAIIHGIAKNQTQLSRHTPLISDLSNPQIFIKNLIFARYCGSIFPAMALKNQRFERPLYQSESFSPGSSFDHLLL